MCFFKALTEKIYKLCNRPAGLPGHLKKPSYCKLSGILYRPLCKAKDFYQLGYQKRLIC